MDIEKIRSDFPALKEDIIYFDNTSATLTPRVVIDAMTEAYTTPGNARSGHGYSVEIMFKVKKAREDIRDLIGAESIHEIIFTKNATEATNFLAYTMNFKKGDVVLTTDREHNSNMVPWQMLNDKMGLAHKVVPSLGDHIFDIKKFEEMMSDKVKLVSMAYTSIIDGYTLPAEEVIKIAHDHGVQVMLDAALTVPYQQVDVKKLDVDFLSFSLHNMCGPAGVGVLYGKEQLLRDLPPFMGGGGTAIESTYEKAEFHLPPGKYEAGAINYPGIIGAGAAVNYLTAIGMDKIQEHCESLTKKLCGELHGLEILQVVCPGPSEHCGRICSFNIEGFNPHDLAIHLEEEANILVRSGLHCAHSWYKAHGSHGPVSVLPYIYNTEKEIEVLIDNLTGLIEEL